MRKSCDPGDRVRDLYYDNITPAERKSNTLGPIYYSILRYKCIIIIMSKRVYYKIYSSPGILENLYVLITQ